MDFLFGMFELKILLPVLLLCCGILYLAYYGYNKFKSIERNMRTQNMILSDFISNIKDKLNPTNNQPANVAAPQAIVAANEYYSDSIPQDKINVSDDGDDGSESADDTQTTYSSHSADSTQIGGDTNEKNGNLDLDPVLELDSSDDGSFAYDTHSTSNIVESFDDNQSHVNLADISNNQSLDSATSSLSEANLTQKAEFDDDTLDGLSFKTSITKETDLRKVRVSQLKDFAVQNNLYSETDVKKIKKLQLIEDIQNFYNKM